MCVRVVRRNLSMMSARPMEQVFILAGVLFQSRYSSRAVRYCRLPLRKITVNRKCSPNSLEAYHLLIYEVNSCRGRRRSRICFDKKKTTNTTYDIANVSIRRGARSISSFKKSRSVFPCALDNRSRSIEDVVQILIKLITYSAAVAVDRGFDKKKPNPNP